MSLGVKSAFVILGGRGGKGCLFLLTFLLKFGPDFSLFFGLSEELLSEFVVKRLIVVRLDFLSFSPRNPLTAEPVCSPRQRMVKHEVLDFEVAFAAGGTFGDLSEALEAARDFETAGQHYSPLDQAFAVIAAEGGRELALRRLDIISGNIELILLQKRLKYFGRVCQKKLRVYSKVHKLLSLWDASGQVRRKRWVTVLRTILYMVTRNLTPVADVPWRQAVILNVVHAGTAHRSHGRLPCSLLVGHVVVLGQAVKALGRSHKVIL